MLGVLILCYTSPQTFPEREVSLLTAYADQLATALDNAQLYAETRAQQTRLAQIFESTSDGIMLVNDAGRIEAANQRVGHVLGFDRQAALGRPATEVLTSCQPDPLDYARMAVVLRSLDVETEVQGDLGLESSRRVVHWVARPTKDAAGRTVGLTLTFRDATQEREISQMKSDFVSFVTHQLRTPLTGIRWMLELAASEPDLPAGAASYVRDGRESAERLIGLVNNLLDISRLERGTLGAAPEPVQLADVTRSVLDEMSVLVREKGHRLSVTAEADVPAAMADPQLLRQAIVNLVSNAIKYTPAGGDITIRVGRGGSAVTWSIQDTGIGVPKRSQVRIFEKFHRAENVSSIETEGTGLGLCLVQLILGQFGGRVWCESEEGRGSTFTFTLPIGRDVDDRG
jgi:PAS domain S-box-containing protein